MDKQRFKVLIIGCGNIAGGYDLRQPEEAMPLGHAKAFRQHGGFELTTCVDPNTEKRQAFQNHWQIPYGFESWKDLSHHVGAFDVVSICSPTEFHAGDIQAALKLKPRLIFCEKPLSMHVAQTQEAIKHCVENQVLLAVNHSRRWSPEVSKLKDQLGQGEWGVVRSVSAVYNKGLLNNGSHMIDLLLNLFGPLHIKYVGRAVFDHFSADPSVEMWLQNLDGVPIQLNLAHAKDYAIFEMQIVTEKGVIDMEDGGGRWRFRKASPSAQLKGYNFLNQGEWLEPEGSTLMRNAIVNLYEALCQGTELACTGTHALQAQLLCERIQQRIMLNTTQTPSNLEVA